MLHSTDISSPAVNPEAEARRTLVALCWPDGRKSCPRCGTPSPYQLAGGRLRCGGCRYTFHDFTGRWINATGLSPRQWIALARAFVREANAREAAAELGISYNTAYKGLTVLRLALLAQDADAPQLLAPGAPLSTLVAAGREDAASPGGLLPVYGIHTGAAGVFVDLLPELTAESVLHYNHNFRLRVARHGGILITDRYKSYDALILCGDEALPWRYLLRHPGAIYAESGACPFWDYARPRLKQFKGLSWRRFPLYMRELALRYNMRGTDLLPTTLAALCAPVPRFDAPETEKRQFRPLAPEQREKQREHHADDQAGDDGEGEGEAVAMDEDVARQAEERKPRESKPREQGARRRRVRQNEQQPQKRHAEAENEKSAAKSRHATNPPDSE